MTIAPFLEDFGPATRAPATPDDMEVALEDQRLAVFEQGYRAGWDDALAAQDKADARASEAFAAALEDLSFPYREALARMIANTAPVIQAIVHQVAPRLLADSLSHIVWEEVETVLRDTSFTRVELVAAPSRIALLSKTGASAPGIEIALVPDDSLGPDRILFRVGPMERQIDFSHIVPRLQQAVAAFEHQSKDEKTHG